MLQMMNLVKEQTMMKQTKKEVIERSLVDRAKEHHFMLQYVPRHYLQFVPKLYL